MQHHDRRKRFVRTNSIARWRVETLEQRMLWIVGGALAGIAVCVFSVTFPLALFPVAAVPTYRPAGYVYHDASRQHHFDNTVWTYGTDYVIAVAILYQMYRLHRVTAGSPNTAIHVWRSQFLLASYVVSVTAGGWAHARYTTVESRNTWHFRLLWTLCVGAVTASVAALGGIATEWVRRDEVVGLAVVPALSGWFWATVGTVCTVACAMGWFSFQRPACDIFVAGVAQSVPTFYLMIQLARGLPTLSLTWRTRCIGLAAFIMMSATLPTYPLAVQYTDWSLGTVNAALHLWLTVAWSAQGWTLRQVAVALAEDGGVPKQVIPVRRVKAV